MCRTTLIYHEDDEDEKTVSNPKILQVEEEMALKNIFDTWVYQPFFALKLELIIFPPNFNNRNFRGFFSFFSFLSK